MKKFLVSIMLALLSGSTLPVRAQNVFIVVIDGLRYSEAYAEKDKNLPFIWNELRPRGTIFTNFRNDGRTVTCPGHAAFLTGAEENLKNDGSERPENPTIFELYRYQTHDSASSCYVVSGKRKLAMLTYSVDPEYGEPYGGKHIALDDRSDTETWKVLSRVMDEEHPRVVLVNFPSVDYAGHDADWTAYLGAIRTADILIYFLWNKIETDEFYRGKTTLFVSSDHGRHDLENGGFRNHGCPCEGCRHIIGLGIGPGFEPGAVVSDTLRQTDVQGAAAELLSVPIQRRGSMKLLPLPRR